ncbi:aspartyl/glutamyl-tRNA amidotransferase subunit B [Syncephalis plumigaleata]|nr:aspartyl/glutamyl-tRNA amidotransferase subunit B [Syncephalis plumigaleata]
MSFSRSLQRGLPFAKLWQFNSHRAALRLRQDSVHSSWQVVIGLEIHAQLCSRHKLFSNASATYEEQPNTQVSVIDAAFPGTLPVIIESRMCRVGDTTCSALSAQIQSYSSFDRKHYFYHDLPAGYQITQHKEPIARGGTLCLSSLDGLSYERMIRLEQLQLEQDTGKSTSDITGKIVHVDLNRAGVPLIEIVTKPDLRSSMEAGIAVRKLQSILRATGVSDGNMEQGSLRCDVNVSVCRPNEPLGVRCELKNLTSIRFLTAAIDAEVNRQIGLLESNERLLQETRGYDVIRKETFSLRTKETAVDYRYMPDPDLPPICISKKYIEQHRATLPELPDARKQRFMSDYGLSIEECNTLFIEPLVDVYFEQVVKNTDIRLAFNWITNELMGRLNSRNIPFSSNTVSVEQLRSIVTALQNDRISGKLAKRILTCMIDENDPRNAETIAEANGWSEIRDTSHLQSICQKLISSHPDKVEQVRQGNKRLFGWFVGQVMQQTKGQASPKLANQLLKDLMNLP